MEITRVALLDAGAQLEKVIIRRVLECGYECDKYRADVNPSKIKDYDAIIISGGPNSVNDPDSLIPNKRIYNLGKPILGICYGLQAIAHQLGGKVAKGEKGQYGRSYAYISEKGPLFHRLSSRERVLMSHYDIVKRIPKGFEILAKSEGLIAAIGNKERKIYAVQFHPELIPVTKNGDKIFENFFWNVCNFPEGEKRPIEKEIENAKKIIKDKAGSDKIVMNYLSGGVDSMVVSLLLKETVEPDRLYIRTLDTGTLRIGEIEEVKKMAAEIDLPNFKILDVKDRFYDTMRMIKKRDSEKLAGPLCYTIDPEIKRKLFGTEYAMIALTEMNHIAHETGRKLDDILLGQGTLRPDMIESGDSRATKGDAHTIKTHHNAVDALKNIPKVEPLVELFKDQVRQVALKLGLNERFAFRQPFPGPGLYCRIIGGKPENLDTVEFLDVMKQVHDVAKRKKVSLDLLPYKTVGVQGDERSYKYPVLVLGDIDWNDFSELALSLPNEIDGINRVLYTPNNDHDFVNHVTKTFMTHDVIKQCQEADLVMREVAERYGFNDSRRCSQMPGMLIPYGFEKNGKRSFVVRPAWTKDFMAIIGMIPYSKDNVPAENPEEHFPEEMFFEMCEEIPKRVEGIDRVCLDVTDKPPGSTEGE